MFEGGIIPAKYDIFMCIVNLPDESIALAAKGPSEMTAMTPTDNKGEINPALKFSQEDLLIDSVHKRRLSPPSPDSTTLPPTDE